jgi:hypothetical protein
MKKFIWKKLNPTTRYRFHTVGGVTIETTASNFKDNKRIKTIYFDRSEVMKLSAILEKQICEVDPTNY